MLSDKDLGDEAVEIGAHILQALHDSKVNPVVGQAALGHAWFHLCKAMGYSTEVFWEMVNGMGKIYEEVNKPPDDGKPNT